MVVWAAIPALVLAAAVVAVRVGPMEQEPLAALTLLRVVAVRVVAQRVVVQLVQLETLAAAPLVVIIQTAQEVALAVLLMEVLVRLARPRLRMGARVAAAALPMKFQERVALAVPVLLVRNTTPRMAPVVVVVPVDDHLVGLAALAARVAFTAAGAAVAAVTTLDQLAASVASANKASWSLSICRTRRLFSSRLLAQAPTASHPTGTRTVIRLRPSAAAAMAGALVRHQTLGVVVVAALTRERIMFF